MLQSKPYNWKWSHSYFQEKTISKTKKQDQNNKKTIFCSRLQKVTSEEKLKSEVLKSVQGEGK